MSLKYTRIVFSDGQIMAIKDGKIVERKAMVEFSKRPAQIFRLFKNAID